MGGQSQASREKLPFRIYYFGSQERRRDRLANTLDNCLSSPLHFAVCRPAQVQTWRVCMIQRRLPGTQGSLWGQEMLDSGRELGEWALGYPSLRHQGTPGWSGPCD